VTLALTGYKTFARVVPSGDAGVPPIESRWDIRWLIGRRTKPTLCVFPVLSVVVMEKCCDACGDREYYLRSGFSA
jgi:hypothetical protein